MDKLDVAIIDCEASSRLTAPAYLAWQRIKEAAKQAPPAAVVDEAMVERALKVLAFEDDGAVFPDAYSDEEADAEREKMRKALAAALQAPPAAAVPSSFAPDKLAERIAYMRRDFDLSTMQRSRFWAEECRMLVEAMLAAAERKGGES